MLIKFSLFDAFARSVSQLPQQPPPPDQTDHQDAVNFRRPSSEYVLGPNWDFHAPPTVREYNWVIQDIVANPDGVFRPMTVINGKFPGELIRCNEGDTVVVNVDNQAANATTIHWHGIFQNGSNFMDGTAGVTQCPIAAGRKFRYEFTVTGQAGTCKCRPWNHINSLTNVLAVFYHSHNAGQALDGLVGPLIVHAKDEVDRRPLPYASDRVVMIQDWYHDHSSGLLKEKLSPGSEAAPIPDGALINGADVVDCSQHPNRRCDSSQARFPVLDLTRDGYHRLRMLNVGAFAWFEVTVDKQLSFFISEIDGVDIMQSPERSAVLPPGQRYSVVVNSFVDEAPVSVWLRARIMPHCFGGENVAPGRDAREARAVVRYTSPGRPGGGGDDAGDNAALPATEKDNDIFTTECRDMNTRAYVPEPPRAAPEYAHHSYYLRVNVEIGDWRLERGFLNQSSYRPDREAPTLHRVLDGLASHDVAFQAEGVNDEAFDAARELVISHDGVEVVDVILQNFDETSHPFHLHGHQMFVLANGRGYFPGYEHFGLKPDGKGLIDPAVSSVIANPTRRDVATVEGFGWTLIRFVADNPGAWLFHCHTVWHSESGMAMQFLSRVNDLRGWSVPPQSREMCEAPVEELEKGAPPKDSTWFGQTDGQ